MTRHQSRAPASFCSSLRSLLIAFLVLVLSGCAAFRITPAGPPLSDRQVEQTVERMEQQERLVTSFYARGILTAKNWAGEEEANIVIAGVKEPFRLKIEVTHNWGQPILHILIDRGRLEVLSFAESTLYMGDFTPEAVSRFLPGPLSRELIWSALRGYPAVLPHRKSLSPQANRIDFSGPDGEKVEMIEFDETGMVPRRAVFPSQQVTLTFSGVVEQESVFHATEVEVDHKKSRGRLVLRKEKTIFNKPVPDEVFTIEKPPGFTVRALEEGR
jgi:hypothetical protein